MDWANFWCVLGGVIFGYVLKGAVDYDHPSK
jgi:hypothetical protein